MATEVVGDSGQKEFALGSIVELRSRLWRVDDLQGDILVATSIDGTPVERRKFYMPFEKIKAGKIDHPKVKLLATILRRI